ncbi:hypothetical protein [Bacillus mycoides]|uniref:hypothetical protein n=1 Tax=Bacillus mycoides TaxID=1405 RepID=UPI000B1D9CF5|nr:hypothetical protein [Bacillus mycoides]
MYQPEDVDGKSQKVRFYLGGPEENLDYLVKAFRSLYKNAEIIEQTMEHIWFSRNKLFGDAVGGIMRLKTKKSYHLLNIKLINQGYRPMSINLRIFTTPTLFFLKS